MRFVFIAKNSDILPLAHLCQIIDVNPRWYQAFRSRPLAKASARIWLSWRKSVNSAPFPFAIRVSHTWPMN